MSYVRFRFYLLVATVFISGVTQGMLMPLISILLEDSGTSSTLNGLNAAALYIGVLVASPFMEKPTFRFGFKPMLMIGLLTDMIAIFLFPFWENFWFWFLLRFIIGIGDNMLHFSAQVWIMETSSPKKKGRDIAIYGFSFGLGFAVGPLMPRLLTYSIFYPFFIVALVSLVILIFMLFLKNDFPDAHFHDQPQEFGIMKRYKKVILLGWAGFITTFGFGFLESSLHGNFPVFALRHGLNIDDISTLLPAFVVGGLLTQMPLGSLGDRIGRARLILITTFFGTLSFAAAAFIYQSFIGLVIIFVIAGMFIGSLYSLGMTFISDLLPKSLIPLGNILASVAYGLGSMFGPLIGGTLIRTPGGGFFFGITGVIFIVFFSCLIHYFKHCRNRQHSSKL
ncbi:MFS family permease [Scopulibacillus daqui]|uniref:MFS family permease n=1 Tax=Scopulibacillus daqui TaxID=1469162 RepID=A0ABS2PYP9_9BACL|nr:MFS transporter [Scopulibacillus daqui]MBM7645183.1 MFS family permease [Scopulibacillus daqui]